MDPWICGSDFARKGSLFMVIVSLTTRGVGLIDRYRLLCVCVSLSLCAWLSAATRLRKLQEELEGEIFDI